MDSSYLKHKNAQLTRAKRQCELLEGEHANAALEYDMFGQDNDRERSANLATSLMKARDQMTEIEKDIKALEGELEAPTTGQDFIGSDPFSFISFFRPSRKTSLIMMVGFAIIVLLVIRVVPG